MASRSDEKTRMQRPSGVQGQSSATGAADTVNKFIGSLRDLHVEARVARDGAETTEALRAILEKSGAKSVVVAGIPPPYAAAVKAALTGKKFDLVEDLSGRPPKEAVAVLEAADLGVTWAVNGVALEGALLEVVYDDSAKLASSLPIVHVALLESSTILRDLVEAMGVVGGIVKGAPPERKPIISFISGPSKTGDIEMRLLYGVHGPHTVHAIILDWSDAKK
jgi:L-lactate dehydrogenase complex protein LldG